MTTKNGKTLSLAIGALIGAAGAAQAAPQFALVDLGSGYMLAAGGEGRCGEGKCGMEMADANKDGKVTRAEHDAHADQMFSMMDANKDGTIDASEKKAHHGKGHEGKCGEGKCGGEKGAHDHDKGKEGACCGDKGKEGACGGSA